MKNPTKDATVTGARRDAIATKVNTDLVPYELILCAALALNYGAAKYAPRNFENGLSYKSLCGSIDRHNRAILDGEEIDEDSGFPHHMLLAASIAMLCNNVEQGVIIDDRASAKGRKSIAEIAQQLRHIEDAARAHREVSRVVKV